MTAEKRIKREEPLKFMLVGLSGVGVNYIILYLMLYIFELSNEISVALAIFVSMSSNYILNRIWTFRSTNPMMKEYLKFITSSLLGALTQYLITIYLDIFLKDLLSSDTLNILIPIPTIYIGSAVGIGFGFVINFLLSKFLVFD